MDAILADGNFKCIFFNENDRILIQISLKFVSKSPIDNKPDLLQVMARHQAGDKPLPELMLTEFTDCNQIVICFATTHGLHWWPGPPFTNMV